MRASDERCGSPFSYVDLEERVRRDHPLQMIREIANAALVSLHGDLDELNPQRRGHPSIPPKRLLWGILLQAFYGIQSERPLMERIEFALLFRWFVGLEIDEKAREHSSFATNRAGLLGGEIRASFRQAVVA